MGKNKHRPTAEDRARKAMLSALEEVVTRASAVLPRESTVLASVREERNAWFSSGLSGLEIERASVSWLRLDEERLRLLALVAEGSDEAWHSWLESVREAMRPRFSRKSRARYAEEVDPILSNEVVLLHHLWNDERSSDEPEFTAWRSSVVLRERFPERYGEFTKALGLMGRAALKLAK